MCEPALLNMKPWLIDRADNQLQVTTILIVVVTFSGAALRKNILGMVNLLRSKHVHALSYHALFHCIHYVFCFWCHE